MFKFRALMLTGVFGGGMAVATEVGSDFVGPPEPPAIVRVEAEQAPAPRAVAAEPPAIAPVPVPEWLPIPAKVEPAPLPLPVRPTAPVATPAAPAAPSAPAAASCVDAGALAQTLFPIDSRWTVRRDFGRGVGYDSGYTYLEGFVPVWQEAGRSLTFGDARVVNYDYAQEWEVQVGGGTRRIVDGTVLGVNGFYDGRNTDVHFYHQLGFGFEALRECWEFRANFYFPIGRHRFQDGGDTFSNPAFAGTNILLDRARTYETAMRGFDLEAGRILPAVCDGLRTYAYLGYYHYDNAGVPAINGIRGRLESWVNERASLHLAVQHDETTHTTLTGGVAVHFGGVPKGQRAVDPLAAKLGNRVVRDPNIVVQRTTDTDRVKAVNPATGLPFEVRHVESYAAAGGDGSAERPFRTLAQLQAGSAPNQILFAHAGSVFNNQAVTLKANQRLLGEGIAHTFTATQGTFLLPRATANAGLPMINGGNLFSPAAVTLANGTEVAGLQIARGGLGINGVNVNNVLIDRNRVISPTNAPSLALTNVGGAGSATVVSNDFNGTAAVTDVGGNSAASFTGNRFLATGGRLLITQVGGTGRFQVGRNQFLGAGTVFNLTNVGGTSTTQFANNRATGGGTFNFQNAGGGTQRLEATLPTNSPVPTVNGGSTTVPVGSAGFGNP